ADCVTLYFFKPIRVVLNYLVWMFGLGLVHSRSWRVWEFDSDLISVVFIGLWDAFYRQKFNVSGIMVELPMYSMINSSWVISNEISYGQGLMLLANFMMSAALIFSSVALFVSRLKAPYPDFLRLCYQASALLLFLSGACTTIAVSWNFTMDFYGQTTLDFPITFPVEREMVTNKRLSYVFPLGITTSILLLVSALLFSCETCSIKPPKRVTPLIKSKC
uniref:Uncharacterized protein n=1 Tax=Moschus moschiferus TaxID=68415 RepID=A0A8C6DAP7_MOSMO